MHVFVTQRRYDVADRWYAKAIAFVNEHDQELWRAWIQAWRSRALLEQGRWDEAEALASDVFRRAPITDGRKLVAMSVLGRLAARRGDPAASELIEQIRTAAQPGEHVIGWIIGSAGALAEAAWFRGDRAAIPGLLAQPFASSVQTAEPWHLGELAYWLHRCDALPDPAIDVAEPYALQLAGRCREAAEAWQAIGCPYNAALALLDAGTEDPLREALTIFDHLGARAARDEAAAKLRYLGVRTVPRARQRAGTPTGTLSSREAQILSLLAEGLRNAEIAQQLFLSERTVEHHVASILRKLNVTNRAEAGRLARRQGVHFTANVSSSRS
jgi:DNA-binding CsgD family transcriptional regulator